MTRTIDNLENYIMIQNLSGINRNFLIKNKRKARFSNAFSFIVYAVIISSIIHDIFISDKVETRIGVRAFEALSIIDWLFLVTVVRKNNKFYKFLQILEDNHIYTEHEILLIEKKTKKQVNLLTSTTIIAMIIDSYSILSLKIKIDIQIILLVSITAHESEMVLYGMLIESINMKLEKLKDLSVKLGARLYKHILIASSHLCNDFSTQIKVMLAVTFLANVTAFIIYSVTDSVMLPKLIIVLIWRVSKNSFCFLSLCNASYRSSWLCEDLAYNLAARLAGCTKLGVREDMRKDRGLLRRWYNAVMSEKPVYGGGSSLTITLSTPLQLMDVSATYLLLFAQIYLAYRR